MAEVSKFKSQQTTPILSRDDPMTTIHSIVTGLDDIIGRCKDGDCNPENDPGKKFPEYKEKMVELTKALQDITKKMVISCLGNKDDEIQEALTNAVQTITLEADYVKLAVTDLGSDDMEAQLLLLTAVKDVANALGDLIGATRAAAGKSHTDPAMEKLKSNSKTMVTKLTSLQKVVKDSPKPTSLEAIIDQLIGEADSEVQQLVGVVGRSHLDIFLPDTFAKIESELEGVSPKHKQKK